MIIGITGTAGAGKTTAARLLGKQLKIKVIDADKIARKALDNKDVKNRLAHAFGHGILTKNKIDRKKLAQMAFSSKSDARKLNSITHPFILKEIRRKIKNTKNIIIDAPLLIETGLHKQCDTVVVVKCSKSVVDKRNKNGHYDVKERTRHQFSEKEKMKYADFVVDNSGNKQETKKQVKEILKKINLT